MSRKNSLLVICKILRLFVNTLTADDMYSLLNRDKLTQPIHMSLSQKRKTFSSIFFAFLKPILTFEHFQRKMNLIVDEFPKSRTRKNVVRQMSKKSCFGRPFDKQHGKRAQTLLKSEREDLYQIYWSLWRQLSGKKSLLVIFKT